MSDIFTSKCGNFTIEVSDDKFSAFLTVKSTCDFLNEMELMNTISVAKIVHGFDTAQDLVSSKSIPKTPGQAFPLAIGNKPSEPELEFSLLFDNKKAYSTDMGKKYSLLKQYTKVTKGTPLAHLFITKPSKSGKNVYGEEVDPENIDAQLIENYIGDNVSYSAERGQIIAEKSGYPYMDDLSRVNIKNEFTLDKDLDLTFDNLDFYGSLIVNGNILDKVIFKIDGDLTVNGNINDAVVEVDGNIWVNGDIINCSNQGVLASQSISFTNAENSKIISGGSIKFKKSAQFCNIIAEKGIFGNEDTSSIVGGSYQSGENIEVAVIGNPGGISTETEITISPFSKQKMSRISKQLLKLKEHNLTSSEEFNTLSDEMSKLEAKLENEINSMLKNQNNIPKNVIAYKRVFPGTYVRVIKKSMHVKEEMQKVSFSIIDGELVADKHR